jgi:hypothetical protein
VQFSYFFLAFARGFEARVARATRDAAAFFGAALRAVFLAAFFTDFRATFLVDF